MTLLDDVGSFARGLEYDGIPGPVLKSLRTCLDFNLGIARAGFPLIPEPLVDYAGPISGTGATVWCNGQRSHVEGAAFVNALAMHARAQDDYLHVAEGHLGAVTIPSVVSMAEVVGSNGQEFLAAVAVAYQLTAALAKAGVKGSFGRMLRATPLYAPLGAAAACTRLAGGTSEQIAIAVALAAQAGAGFNQPWIDGTSEWRIHAATASQTAVRCALLAMAGAEASPHTLEGAAGFYVAMSGSAVDARQIADDLTGPWFILDAGLKNFPVCGLNQGPAMSAVTISRQECLRAAEIEAVRLEMRPEELDYPGMRSRGPFGGAGAALMSAPYVVATALLAGDITFRSLEASGEASILRLAAAIELRENDSLKPLEHVLTVSLRDRRPVRLQGIATAQPLDEKHKSLILQRVAAEVGDPGVSSAVRTELIEQLHSETHMQSLLAAITG